MTKKEKYDPEGKISPQGDQHKVTADLLQEKGIARYIEIDGDTEGDVLPGDIPNKSGMILTEDGKVYSYWLDWDPEKEPPERKKVEGVEGWYTLGENKQYEVKGEVRTFFREIPPESEAYPKPDDYAFLGAKRELGLPLTEEELNILKEEWKWSPEMMKKLRLE